MVVYKLINLVILFILTLVVMGVLNTRVGTVLAMMLAIFAVAYRPLGS